MRLLTWMLELPARIEQRIKDADREKRISDLKANELWAHERGAKVWPMMLRTERQAIEACRSPAQLARMAKKKAQKVTHE